MGNKESLVNLRYWTKRLYLSTISIGFTSTAGLMYLYESGHKFFATTLTVLGLGTAYLYWRNAARAVIRSNHAVIVTGCDSGLGYSLALHCRSLNAVVIAGVLQPDGIGAKDLIRNGVNVIPLDVTKRESITKFGISIRELVAKENLVIRALVNNAGVMIFGEFEWQTDDQTRRQVEVNLLGTMGITKELMPIIRSMQSRIIVVTSHCSSQPLPGAAAYGATKAAVSAWATALRVEVAKYGIDVVCFVPGSFTGESNLMASQNDHFAAMRSAMSDEARHFYGNYFTRYTEYLSGISREIIPQKVDIPMIYDVFDGALTDVYPQAVYKCEPWRYTFYHLLFKTTPLCIRDRLVERFIMMPKWKEPRESDAPVSDGPEILKLVESKDANSSQIDETFVEPINSYPESFTLAEKTDLKRAKEGSLSR